ncbi:dTDP-4-dehydrorhamnose reductase [Halomonas sp. HK25]|uniref:dTDP-4-dehydrorhamnose reductase n=1 Tax=Halomonas sp. HK25 TaxID=3394321 RepID=UPI0039FD63FC
MRVLITGANGQVGHELVRLAPEGMEVIGLSSAELDITRGADVQAKVEQYHPGIVINAAAYTAVDRAEQEPERAYAVNDKGVRHLAQAAASAGVPLLHISTDYVFDGNASTAYLEEDTPCPTGVYGASKLAGEQALAEALPRNIILRTSWVFGSHGNNFVKTMLRLGREREELSVVADQYGCPTSAASIARALWALAVLYRDQGELEWGVYHFAGTPHCTWYDFAEAVFEVAFERGYIHQKPFLNAIGTVDYPTPANRPAWSVLDSSLLNHTFSMAPLDWREELRNVLDELGTQETP